MSAEFWGKEGNDLGHGRLFTTLKEKLKLKPVDKVSQGGSIIDYESLHGDECEDLLRGLWGDDGLLSTLARNTKTPRSNASVKHINTEWLNTHFELMI